MIKHSLTLAALITFAGCATTEEVEEIKLDAGAEKIRILMSEQKNCKFISELTGYYAAKDPYEETDEKARTLLKNQALAKKANAVVIVSIERHTRNEKEGYDNPASTKIFGNAYNCWNVDNIR